ncbi:MAG: hypothetical protein F4X94_03215 [Dehalococcoidia bacterium]|nr:hypothetical protein [Dehalococcoidia bacterium]
MPLESLLELVKTLSDRIDEHGPALRQSEALTRYALIDPLLRELGWDTEDPNLVIPEYSVNNNKRTDYVLLSEGHPTMIVEAKSLDTHLGDDVIFQALAYSMNESADHFAVTNGRQWKIYDSTKSGNLEQKLIVSIDLNENAPQVCLKALALWQPSVMFGQVKVGQPPILDPTEEPQIQQTPAKYEAEPVVSAAPTVPALDAGDWQPLSVFNAVKGSSAPIEIGFPDNSTTTIKNWKSIIIEIVNWLINEGLLNQSHCPVTRPRARTRYIIHTSPTHPSGNQFVAAERVGPLYIETNSGSTTIVNQARFTIEKVGQDPSLFKVRLP